MCVCVCVCVCVCACVYVRGLVLLGLSEDHVSVLPVVLACTAKDKTGSCSFQQQNTPGSLQNCRTTRWETHLRVNE